tara:strand:+ start:9408 stop:10598 length:1191 start_codon:yes stop_codon:yes gene_type:complete
MTALERRSVASLALLYAFRMLGLFMVLPLLALYADDMPGATTALIGLALGIYGLTQAALQIPFGWLSDRIGRKPVIIAGLLMFALGSVVAALAESVWGIILGRTLQGAGAIASTVMALVADLTSPAQRTKAMALVGISIGLSFAVALVLGPLVASFGGLPAVFWFTALLAASGIAVLLFLVPTPKVNVAAQQETGLRAGMLSKSFFDGTLARLNFGVFCLHFTLMAAFLLIPSWLELDAGVSRESHWMVYLPVLLLSLIGMVPLMSFAERGGRPRAAFLIGIVVLLSAVGVMGMVHAGATFYIGLWLFFVGFNYLEATLPSLVSKTAFSDSKGTAMGVYSTCQFLGAFAGGAAGGWLLQHMGEAALVLACLLLVAAWGMSVLLSPSQLAGEEPSRL